ncbi:hypothetical protein C435_21954 [Haloarcula marismortui ATCC 33799]|uniref:Uncharacterized protein n=1 Tax=Haloarcula marismortui ATCC 33799 TaxID=662475 RepID=M0JPG9_9EURY|nr:hypothetical protein C435_21954 [Haloarcula californiae ATCC 33799]
MIQRGSFSLYLSIDQGWQQAAGLDIDDTCRLEIENVGESSLAVALYIDEDYSTVADPPGQFDIEPVDIQTGVQWCLPADVRREFGISEEFAYSAEYHGDGEIYYELKSPTVRDDRLLA